MDQTLTGNAEPMRSAAPTDARTPLRLRVLAASLVVGGGMIWALRQDWATEQIWPWLLLLAGMFAAAQALRRLALWLPGRPVPPRLAAFRAAPLRWSGLFEMGIALLLTGILVWRLWPDPRNWQNMPLLWAAAMLLFLLSAWLVGAVGQAAPRAAAGLSLWPNATRSRRWELAGFLLILILAIFLRSYRLDSIPPGIYVDETNGALDALHILEGRPDSPFGSGWYGTPNGYLYYMAAMIKLLGANWLALKLISLIPAVLTVPAVYLLARLLFGPLAGLSAMLLMAVSRWHLSMSRWGWNETAPPLFQVLATYFLLRGLRDRRATDYALSGLLAGLSIYTYLSARLALATLALYLLYWFLSDPSGPRSALRRSGAGIVILLVGLVIAVAPIAVSYAKDPFSFGNRTAEISVLKDIRAQGSLAPLGQNIVDILKFFHQTGDHQGKHNLPDEPMADPFTGLLFALGLTCAILGRHDQRRALLLLWLIIGLAGSFLSTRLESPQAYRSLTALPAVVLLAADALDQLVRALYRWINEQPVGAIRPAAAAWAASGLALLALGGAAAWESSTFFGRQAASIDVALGFNPMENHVAQEVITAIQAGKEVYLSPSFSEFSPLRYLLYGVVKEKTGQNTLDSPPYQVLLPEVSLPLPDHGQDVLILLDQSYWPLRGYLSALYPQAQMELVYLPDGPPLYVRMQIAQPQLAALQGLTQTVSYADGHSEEQTVSQIAWNETGGQVSQVMWEGALRLEHGGRYALINEGGLDVTLDDLPSAGEQYLGRGLYQLRVILDASQAASARLSWRGPGQTEPQPIPAEALFQLRGFRKGLQGTYWANTNWEGTPAFQQVTPFLLLSWPDEPPIVPAGPFSARYTGLLQITQEGAYLFRVEADDGARLVLDGEVIGEGLTPNQPNTFEAVVDLMPGQHAIQVDYFQQGGGSALRLFWAHAQEPLAPIPPDVLTPAEP